MIDHILAYRQFRTDTSDESLSITEHVIEILRGKPPQRGRASG